MGHGVSSRLKELNKEWEGAEERQSGFFSPEDGNYDAILFDAEIQVSSKSERLQIAWSLRFNEGKYEGKEVLTFDGLDDEISMGYTKGRMKLLGIEIPKKLAELPEVISDYFKEHKDGVRVGITVKTKNEFTNIYINEVLEDVSDTGKTKSKDESSKSSKRSGGSAKQKKITIDMLDDMDKEQLIELIDERGLDIGDPEKLREGKLRVQIADALGL